jgi:hypothetical protein
MPIPSGWLMQAETSDFKRRVVAPILKNLRASEREASDNTRPREIKVTKYWGEKSSLQGTSKRVFFAPLI